jgi:hypothetical protein
METPTQFDLIEALRMWRTNLKRLPEFQNGNVEELEAHMIDSIELLRAKGLSEEEAFWIATRRVGSSEKLALEFGKVNARTFWLSRALWMLAGVEIASLLLLLTRTATGLLFVGGASLDPQRTWLPVTGMLFSWVFLGSLIGVIWWRLTRRDGVRLPWLAKCLRHPIIASASLIAFSLALQCTSVLTAWFYLQGNPPSAAAQQSWTALSSAILSMFVVPVALVYLARIRERQTAQN